VIEHVPTPTMVAELPLTVHTDVSFEANDTDRFEVDDAVSVTGASPYVAADNELNVMVWFATFTTSVAEVDVTDDTAPLAPEFFTTTV
jgi:hypothetical protein